MPAKTGLTKPLADLRPHLVAILDETQRALNTLDDIQAGRIRFEQDNEDRLAAEDKMLKLIVRRLRAFHPHCPECAVFTKAIGE